jgi:type IV secretion system protein VirB11
MIRPGETTLRHLLTPVQDVLDNPATTEIVVQRSGEVGIEQHGHWSWRDVEVFDFQRLDAIGLLAGSLLSKPFDPAHPICMTTLPDGQRCTLLRPPVTAPGTLSVTIRIPSKAVHTVRDADFGELMREAEIPTLAGRSGGHSRSPGLDQGDDPDAELLALYQAQDWAAFFALAVKAKKTIAATGSTGSGKTSLLRRLMQEIPGEERLVTIEDTDEFGPLPMRNRVSLFYGSANVSAENAVEASLRMRPDRVAMQELRGAEAFAYLRLLAAGHPGGLTTWHAEEGDPFTPLALMAKTSEAGRNIPDDKLLVILRSLIDIVAFCRRDARGFSVPSVYYRTADVAQ